MKGPRSRHRFNVMRVWECPACQQRVFAAPQVVTRSCNCQGKDRPTCMRLIDITPRGAKSPLPTVDQPGA